MKKSFTRASLITMILISMMLLTACPSTTHESRGRETNNSKAKPLAVAVIAGWRTGNPAISVNTEEIMDAVYDSCYSCGFVSFARVDGAPEQYLKVNIPEPDVEGLSEAKQKSIAEGYRDDIFAAYMQYGAAQCPEADTLEAIRMEAATLREAGLDTEKHLIIIDSGLSTTGYLNFLEDGIFEANTDDIIDRLKQAQAIPDLSGISSITWLYCGETASPQEKLSEVQKNKIKEIYSAVFEAGHASNYVFKEDVPSGEPYKNLPEVSTISSEGREIPPFKTVILDSSKVSFIGDESNFINTIEAKEAIKEVADKLIESPGSTVFVAGSTAGMDGESAWCKELSEDRANAVASVLEEYGVPADRLIPIGLGSNAPWHIDDVGPNGLIEDKAQLNRCVYIVDINDAKFGDALAQYR